MGNQTDVPTFAQDPQQAEALWCFAELQLILADGERTGDAFAVVEHEAPQGHSPPWHRQPGDDETFYVLDGEISFWAEDSTQPMRRAGAGALVFIPRGTPHSFRIESPSARWLTLHAPAGHERFYRASGEPAKHRSLPPAGEPDMDRVQAAAAKHGVELLGPPPGSMR